MSAKIDTNPEKHVEGTEAYEVCTYKLGSNGWRTAYAVFLSFDEARKNAEALAQVIPASYEAGVEPVQWSVWGEYGFWSERSIAQPVFSVAGCLKDEI